MKIRVTVPVVAACLILLSGAFAPVATDGAERMRVQDKPILPCSKLLTAEELTTAVGEKMSEMGARERGPGESECPWMLRGGSSGFKTVAVQFYELSHIKASPTASTPDAYFEMVVAAAEGTAAGSKREVLPGIAVKAVFVQTTPQVLAVVQRADGVARIVGNNLTKAQITAVARAVGAP